ncbi:MAG: copper chaperone PCu(A)C [Caldimonas sp.]
MKRRTWATGLLALAAAMSTASAHEFKAGDLSIGHPYARPTAPSQPTGGGYLTLMSKGRADRLLSASTTIAREVQLHSMKMDGDVMRMREVDAIDVPADTLVELKPGGFHLMFVGLKEPLKVGQPFPLKLRFEKAGEVTVQINVDAPGAKEAPPKTTH